MQSLSPAFDYLIEGEGDGLAALHRTVEDRAVNQQAVVVHFDPVGGLGRDPGASLQFFEDKAGSRLHGSFFLGGLFPEGRALCRSLGLSFLQALLQHGADLGAEFLQGDNGLAALEGVGKPLHDQCYFRVAELTLEWL